jgi:hypothetical protein
MKEAWLDTPPRRRRRGFCNLSIEKSTNRHRKFFSQGDARWKPASTSIGRTAKERILGEYWFRE